VGERARRPRSRRSDAQRNIDAILDAAARLLDERPRASMQEIARAAGVHRATVHRHFASRDDLLVALRDRSLDAFVELATDDELLAGEPAGALRRFTQAVLEGGDRDRGWRVLPVYDGAAQEREDAYLERLLGLMARGQGAGKLRADLGPEHLLMAWGGLVVAALPRIAQGRMDPTQATDFVLRLLAPAA